MKKLIAPARILFGAIWLIFGLNFYFNFFQLPPPNAAEGALLGALFNTGYFLHVVKVLEISCGALLILNLFVPLSLVVLSSITVNIFLIHTLLDQAGLPLAVLLIVLNVFLGFAYIENYKPMLKAKA